MSYAVIIPSKSPANLIPCLTALRKHEPDCPVVVVDDGIGDQGVDAAAFCEPIKFIPGIKPFVFARNVNLGIRMANEFEGVYWKPLDGYVLLNDDALLESPRGFRLLERTCAEHPEIGVIGATCNEVGNPNQWRKDVGLRFEPRMVCFVAVFVPRRTIEAVGLLDEEFVGYGFDDDSYCVRVRRAGLKIAIHDGCWVDHSKLSSTFRSPGGPGGDMRQNAEIFRKKYGAGNWEV